MALPIVYEDEALVAFDQPAGHPIRVPPPAAPAHRLEAEASGLLLCAKTKAALDFLSGQFQAKTAGRRFLALVVAPHAGLAEAFSVELALGEDPERPDRMRAFRRRGGRPAATDFRVLETFGRFAWVEAFTRTGRRHQVRVHLAEAGAPVLGDALYGDPSVRLLLSEFKRGYKGRDGERPLLDRLALHSSSLEVAHPLTRDPIRIEAPVPGDLSVALKVLRRYRGRSRR